MTAGEANQFVFAMTANSLRRLQRKVTPELLRKHSPSGRVYSESEAEKIAAAMTRFAEKLESALVKGAATPTPPETPQEKPDGTPETEMGSPRDP